MRELIQRHSVLISVISVVIVVIVLSIKFAGSTPGTAHNSDSLSDECWYYDVASDKYVRDKIDRLPPFVSAEGTEQVRVVFFSCGGCNQAEWFPGYYLKYTTELSDLVRADPSLASSLHGESVTGRLFSLDGKTWIAAADAVAAGVHDHHRNRCDGKGSLKMCR